MWFQNVAKVCRGGLPFTLSILFIVTVGFAIGATFAGVKGSSDSIEMVLGISSASCLAVLLLAPAIPIDTTEFEIQGQVGFCAMMLVLISTSSIKLATVMLKAFVIGYSVLRFTQSVQKLAGGRAVEIGDDCILRGAADSYVGIMLIIISIQIAFNNIEWPFKFDSNS